MNGDSLLCIGVSVISFILFSTADPSFGLEENMDYFILTSNSRQIQFQYPSDGWSIIEKKYSFQDIPDMTLKNWSSQTWIEFETRNYTSSKASVQSIVNQELATLIKNGTSYEYKTVKRPSFLKIDNYDAGTYLYSFRGFDGVRTNNYTAQDWVIPYVGDHGYILVFMSKTDSFDSAYNTAVRDQFINSVKFLSKTLANLPYFEESYTIR